MFVISTLYVVRVSNQGFGSLCGPILSWCAHALVILMLDPVMGSCMRDLCPWSRCAISLRRHVNVDFHMDIVVGLCDLGFIPVCG